MTQNDLVLEHLKSHVGITPNEAKDLYSIDRLASRIFDLRQRGHKIQRLWRTEPNKFGKHCRIAEYRLVRE